MSTETTNKSLDNSKDKSSCPNLSIHPKTSRKKMKMLGIKQKLDPKTGAARYVKDD